MMNQAIFHRTELLVGEDMMTRFHEARVIIFGVGGVGSWCAESLIRSGIGHLTLVDSDRVSITNVNRQLMATTKTVGMVKVEVLKERLLDINPEADITALQKIYSEETADDFSLEDYDYVIDAIDSLKDKALLILNATRAKTRLFSSMGAALKLDPFNIKCDEFWNVKGDPLAAALRRKFKKNKTFPKRKFKCVYSDEIVRNRGVEKPEVVEGFSLNDTTGPSDPALLNHDWSASKACINGTLAHTTAIFGLSLAGLVVMDLMK